MRPFVTLAGLALIAMVLAYVRLAMRVEGLESELARIRPAQAARAAAPAPVIPRADLSDLEKSTIALFSARSKSVVHITTLKVQTDLFRRNALEVPQGIGSGFIWDTDGHVVTNFHVIQDADAARVTLSDHSVWNARLVGRSERNDIAVLRIDAPNVELSPIVVGSSHDLAVGQQVFAIGSPFGLDYTLSTGVISGLGREIQGELGLPILGAIQTDAAINRGNSGGPLLDSSGRLIGMNTAILSPSGGSAGIGFAVPIDTIARAVPQLIKYGREVRPSIGVQLAEDALTQRFGLRGALILNVLPNSPAARAGLRGTTQDGVTGRINIGDLIVAVNGTEVNTNPELYLAIEKHKAGDRVKLGLMRAGQPLEVEVELASNVNTP